MIIQNNTCICTIKELAKMIAKRILKNDPGETPFSPVDFSLLSEGYDGNTEPEVVASSAEGWYGIRRVDTGFDDNGLTLCANYYCGCGRIPRFCYLYKGCSELENVKVIYQLILGTLRAENPYINSQTMLVVNMDMEKQYWYAVMSGHDDENWHIGSYDYSKAEEMAVLLWVKGLFDTYIAVIDEGTPGNPTDPICIRKLFLSKDREEPIN